jgi:ABC-2 type transport system ATP-binding protein
MEANNIIIKTSKLTKKYGNATVVNKLNLEIPEGEVFGLLGPNGAGKTTTILMLLGLTEPAGGTAEIAGHDCTRDPLSVKKIVGYLPDNVGFYGDMTGRENLRFVGYLNNMKKKETEEKIDLLLSRVGMSDAADKKVGAYSKGMKQRLGIADVLMKDPRVVILDEPTLGIDPEGMRELMELIRDLAVKDHRTVLISSHQLYQVQQVCDRVGIFVKGKLVACGPIEELGRQVSGVSDKMLEFAATPDDAALMDILASIGGISGLHREKEYYLIHSDSDVRSAVIQAAISKGYSPTHLKQRGDDLDEIYRLYFAKGGAV